MAPGWRRASLIRLSARKLAKVASPQLDRIWSASIVAPQTIRSMTAARVGEADARSAHADAFGIWLMSEIFSAAKTARSSNPIQCRKSRTWANSSELPMWIGIGSPLPAYGGGVSDGMVDSEFVKPRLGCAP